MYRPFSDKLVLLTGCPINLFFFLCEECSMTNQVSSDSYVMTKFNEWIKQKTSGELTYSDPMIRKAFKSLRDVDLLIQANRGRYVINPFYFWKSEKEEDRIHSIRYVIEKLNYVPAT
jgi:hypothetical protein